MTLGIVKNYLDIRWSEPFWDEEEQWKPYSRWELMEARNTEVSDGDILSRLLVGKKQISYEDFENIIEFNGEPFERRRTAGLHKVKIDD